MKPSDPLIKPFRDRPRAVSCFVCRRANANDFGVVIEGLTYDLLAEAKSAPLVVCILQGRIETEDVISVEALDLFGILRWSQIQRAGRASGKIATVLNFEIDNLADFADGMYDLVVRCNQRLCGRIKVKIGVLRSSK